MTVVVLDAAALSALAGRTKTEGRRRLQILLVQAAARDAPVIVPSAVLAEGYRGDRTDAALDHALSGRGVRVVTTGRRIARVAGGLRHKHRLDSCHVVDCIVVATAVRLGGGIIATADEGDISLLASGHPNVKAYRI